MRRLGIEQAFIDRWVKSICVECLDFFIVFGKKYLDHLVGSYLTYYNGLPTHQGFGIGNKPLSSEWPEVEEPLALGERIISIDSLGGVLEHYD